MKIKKQHVKDRYHTAKILYISVFFSFVIPIVYLIFRLIFLDEMIQTNRSRADYSLMLLQCVLGVIMTQLPSLLSKRLRIKIPIAMYLMYLVFLYCAIFLGEVGNFYYVIPYWDDILHLFSSIMTGFFGYMVIAILNSDEKVKINLSPIFAAMFAFCFSISIGALWEIYEYTFDGLLGINMQKFLLEDGSELIGRLALSDTMRDIIVDCVGAAAATITGYLSLKRQKGFVHDYLTDDSKTTV